jgi:hypothetical protein
MKKRINKTPVYIAMVATLAMVGLVMWVALERKGDAPSKPKGVPSSNIDPFSGPLVIDAPGCEIKGLDGKSIKDSLRISGQLTIPKGTSFNGDCFPAAKAAREADAKSRWP